MTTLAGNGTIGSEDGKASTEARLHDPRGISVVALGSGNFAVYIIDGCVHSNFACACLGWPANFVCRICVSVVGSARSQYVTLEQGGSC